MMPPVLTPPGWLLMGDVMTCMAAAASSSAATPMDGVSPLSTAALIASWAAAYRACAAEAVDEFSSAASTAAAAVASSVAAATTTAGEPVAASAMAAWAAVYRAVAVVRAGVGPGGGSVESCRSHGVAGRVANSPATADSLAPRVERGVVRPSPIP